jgi:hypothetical protein
MKGLLSLCNVKVLKKLSLFISKLQKLLSCLGHFAFIAPKTLNDLAFQYFDFEHT